MDPANRTPLDLDHVVSNDGRIYRVLGNLASRTHFLGYNVYSPSIDGARLYRGTRYKKNFIEDERLPADVLETYELVNLDEVIEHHDPIQSAKLNSSTFKSTVWFDLYTELVTTFGIDSVGIFGSSMFGLHLTPEGTVRKDIDFVIQGTRSIERLRQRLPHIRKSLGFTEVTVERQLQQYDRYQRVFRNPNNSIRTIIARRWTALQLTEQVVTTIRLRDPAVKTPIELATTARADQDVVLSGRVAEASSSNLFPRRFSLLNGTERTDIYIMWWKLSTPVRDGDTLTLCGSLITANGRPIVRLSDFTRHWIQIAD